MEPLRGRRKNHRLFPGAKHRSDLAKTRQEEAKERQTAYNQLSVAQKIQALDVKFGIGVGAVRQRARLTILLQPTTQNQA
jgi:hypothetical protein